MASLMASLPLQVLCQLIVSSPADFNHTHIATVEVNQSPRQIEPAVLPAGYVARPDIGVAYKVHNEIVQWKEARKQCILEGGNLAVIDSHAKSQYVLNQRRSNGYTHVGITRMYDEWVSVSTGSPVSAEIPWASGEPAGPTSCVVIKNVDGGLANYNCNTMGDYVCEIPILATKISAN